LQPGDWIGRQSGLLFQRMLTNPFKRFVLREILDLFCLLDGAGAARERVEESFHLRFAILRFQNLHPQINGRHGCVGRHCDLRCSLLDQIAKLGPARQLQQAEFRRGLRSAESAFHILIDGMGIVALVFINGAGLVRVKVGVGQAISPLAQQAQRILEIEIVPINRGRFEISAGLAGSGRWDALPVGRGLRKQIAVSVDVANARHGFGIARAGLQQIVFDLRGDGGVRRFEVRE